MTSRFIIAIAALGLLCVGCGNGEKAGTKACNDFFTTTNTLPLLNGAVTNLKLSYYDLDSRDFKAAWKKGKKYIRHGNFQFNADVDGKPAKITFLLETWLTNKIIIKEIYLRDPNPTLSPDMLTSATRFAAMRCSYFFADLHHFELQLKEVEAWIKYLPPTRECTRNGFIAFDVKDRSTTDTGLMSMRYEQWKDPYKAGFLFHEGW